MPRESGHLLLERRDLSHLSFAERSFLWRLPCCLCHCHLPVLHRDAKCRKFSPKCVYSRVKAVSHRLQLTTTRSELLSPIEDRICQSLPQILCLPRKLDDALRLFIQTG